MLLLTKQKAAVAEALHGLSKLLYLVGGIRSGKSVVATIIFLWMLDRLARARIKGQFILGGHSVESVRTNIVVPYLLPFMDQRHWEYRDLGGSRPRIITRGQEILLFGGADRRSEHRMRGMTASGALIDEVAKVEESFFFQTLERCSANKAKVITTTNKRGNWDWEKRKIVDRLRDMNGALFEFELEDNVFLDKDYVSWVSSAVTGHYNARDIKNIYAEATGLVYTDFEVREPDFDWFNLPKFVGVDWAQSGPTAAVAIVPIPGQPGRYHAVDEYFNINEISGLDHHGHAAAMAVQWPNIEEIYRDPSAPYMQQAFELLGLYCLSAENDVLKGLASVNGALFRRELVISPRCENLLRELSGYAWREPTKNGVEEHPIKKNDHAADALRYICMRLFPVQYLIMPANVGSPGVPAGVL